MSEPRYGLDDQDPMYAEEQCFDCDGGGCDTCADTGLVYTQEAIRLQVEAADDE